MKIETINCNNYFNEGGCVRLSEALEAGKAVNIYIDCIGHTRSEYETANYVEWLRGKYGDRLERVSGYMAVYRLK